jgi:hypothetical protein
VGCSLKERRSLSGSKNMFDHVGKTVSSHNDLLLDSGNGSFLVLS